MQPLIPSLLLLAILAGALAYLWWPANWIIESFIARLRREAGVDKANLDKHRNKQRKGDERIAEDDIFDLPAKITGRFERYLAFFLVVAFGLEGSVVTVLLAWMGAKLIANWQRRAKAPSYRTK